MAACRASENTDALRIDLKACRILLHKADGGLHILQLTGPLALGRIPVVDGNHHITGPHILTHFTEHQILIGTPPAAAGDPDQCRFRAVILPGIILSHSRPHLGIAVLQHDGKLQLHRIPRQILHMGINDIIHQGDAFFFKSRIKNPSHVYVLLRRKSGTAVSY